MDRRDYLKVAGGAGALAIGGFGAYTLLFRDGEVSPPEGAVGGESTPTPSGDTDGAGTNDDEDTPTPDQVAETREGQFLHGISPPSRDLSVLDPHEAWLEQTHAVVGIFVDMNQSPEHYTSTYFENAWQRGHVPHVFWQPFFPERSASSDDLLTEISDGQWDDPIEDWANTLAAWAIRDDEPDRRLFLNLAPEFNGDWAPWSPALGREDDEAAFVEMWRRIHDFVMDAGLDQTHVQWLWTLDNTTRGVDREACWPGDAYVDWTGLHGYNWANWGGWRQPVDLYDRTIDVIRRITDKPLALTEFGCSSETEEGGNDPEGKNAWIVSVYEYFAERDIRMSLWFDIVKETDWAVFDVDPAPSSVDIDGVEYGKYPAYREVVTSDGIPSHPDHPRHLTDEEFWGIF